MPVFYKYRHLAVVSSTAIDFWCEEHYFVSKRMLEINFICDRLH